MIDQLLVSIILPTYNRCNLLSRAIDSVIKQTYSNWELIIIDDGSTDNTFSLVQSYKEHEQRILYLAKKNEGPAASRNSGLEIANGHYVTFLDSDDEYHRNHIFQRVAYMQSHDVQCIHGGIIVIGTEEQMYVPDVNDRTKKIAIAECVVGGTFFGLREIFLSVGGWREGFSEDSDLFNRIQKKYKTDSVDFKTYMYHRDSTDSRCNQFSI